MRRYVVSSHSGTPERILRFVRADNFEIAAGILEIESEGRITHVFAPHGWDSIIDVTEEDK